MKRMLLSLLVPLLAAGMAIASLSGRHDQGPVYSLATVRGHLARDPHAWIRRVVRVRATPEFCPPAILAQGSGCIPWYPVLAPPDASDPTEPLPLLRGTGAPLLAFLRRLPALGSLLPAPQAVDWGSVSIYRVQLGVTACDAYQPPPCYAAQLLDAAPGPLGGDGT